MKPQILAKKDRVKYELILAWSSSRVPFCSQKLAFYAGAKFSLAYKDAVHIKDILQRSGGFKKSEVKLLAFGVCNVMQAYMEENQPYLLKKKKDLAAQVGRFLKSDKGQESADKKKETKDAYKELGKFKGKHFEMEIVNQPKPKKIEKIAPAKIAPLPVPMIDARKPKKKDK